jgi:hypothetical protein
MNQYYGNNNKVDEMFINNLNDLSLKDSASTNTKDTMAYNYYFGNGPGESGNVRGTTGYENYEEFIDVNHPEYVNVNVNNYNYNYINTTGGNVGFTSGGGIPEYIPKRYNMKKQYQFQNKKKYDNNNMSNNNNNYGISKTPQVMARYFVIKSVDEDNIHKVKHIPNF